MNKIPLGPAEIGDLSQALRRTAFFNGMSIGDLERFVNITTLYEYPAGKTVFKKGEVG